MAEYIAEPRARIIADSVSEDGHRLTTMEVTMHRFVLAEFNTHRVFSRNSASSRAIPGRLQRQRVLTSPAVPLEWPEKLAGMQGGELLPQTVAARTAALWRKAAIDAATTASMLDSLGVHKSVTNRLLEPFLYQTVLVTSTDWQNFFAQRADSAAQPEIRVPAEMMLEAYENSTPDLVEDGRYHRPLLDKQDYLEIGRRTTHDGATRQAFDQMANSISVARCARVSYLNHDGERDIDDDLKLYNRLATYGHWSPFEHVATPCLCGYEAFFNPVEQAERYHKGNFVGWDQLRHV